MNERLENTILNFVSMTVGETYVVEHKDVYKNKELKWIGKKNDVVWFTVKPINKSVLYVNMSLFDMVGTMFNLEGYVINSILIKWFNKHQDIVKVSDNSLVLFILGQG